jgi:xanthine dehydrogenase accessory factor
MVRAGWQVLLVELAHPMSVRRMVSFSQAVYDGEVRVENVTAHRVNTLSDAQAVWQAGALPVMVDPNADIRHEFKPHVIIDARMRKSSPELTIDEAPLVIGLGPGFQAGLNCHAVIETIRGPFLGRVIWDGPAEADTGIPEGVGGIYAERVLRAPVDGFLRAVASIGDRLLAGELIAEVEGQPIHAPFDGVLRGLVQPGLAVRANEKVGDLDPRNDPRLCWLVSDKALAVGGGVLEAILSFPKFRIRLAEMR